MSLCRAASQALAARLSRAPAAAGRLTQRAPPRQMSSGSAPGPSRDSTMIYLLAGVAAVGGLFYAYRVVSSPRSKFVENTNVLRERAEEQQSNPWSSKEGAAEEVDGVPGAEEATEEAEAAVEPAAQEGRAAPPAQEGRAAPPAQEGRAAPPAQEGSAAPPAQEGRAAPPAQEGSAAPPAQEGRAAPPAQEGTPGVSPGGDGDSLAPQECRAGEEAQQEAAADSEADASLELAENSEAAAVQVSEEEKTPEEVAEEP